jgi:hypothetical protein
MNASDVEIKVQGSRFYAEFGHHWISYAYHT